MRSWLTTREVQTMLGNVSQQYVSKLVRKGVLAVERDRSGANQYDRESVEAHVRKRAAIHAAQDGESDDERIARQTEARDRFRRQRQREIEAEQTRQDHLDALREREVKAIEGIYECLRQR